MSRYDGYEIELTKHVSTKRQALAMAEEMKQTFGGRIKINPLAKDRCPGDPKTGYTMDHSHARYDGDKWCNCCGGKL